MSTEGIRSAVELQAEVERLRRRVAELENAARERSAAETVSQVQRDLALALNTATNLTEVFNVTIEAAGRISAVDCGGLYLVDPTTGALNLTLHRGISASFVERVRQYGPSSPHVQLTQRGEAIYAKVQDLVALLGDLAEDEGLRFVASVPVNYEGQVRAVLNLASHRRDDLPPAERQALETIVAQVGPILVRMIADEEVQRERILLRRLLELHERDRQLLAYEIHDGFAQQLTGALLNLESYDDLRQQNEQESRRALERSVELIREALKETRRLISGLRPPILDESGIVAALEYLAFETQKHYGLKVSFSRTVSFTRLATPIENALFRVAQEALINAARHSGSDRVQVSLTETAERVRLEIRDEGRGFNPGEVEEGRFGLQGIRERARLLNGMAMIQSASGQGTHITLELPRMPARAEPGGGACDWDS